jgi:hypothetical protein
MRAEENSSLSPRAIMSAAILRMVAFRDRATATMVHHQHPTLTISSELITIRQWAQKA